MRIIEKLDDHINEELEGAEHYAKCALKHREDNPSLAKTMHAISTDEMHHVSMLHDEVVKLIERHRADHGEPPAAMLAVWEYMHDKHLKEATKIKMLQAEYKGM
jgi:ferritin